MSKALSVTRRELKSYFDSPIAYIVIVSFLLIAGWIFFNTLFVMGRADLRTFFTPFSPIFFSPAMLLVILAPAITMRLVAEERKTGTIELLTTMPIRSAEVVIGKFLAALVLTATSITTSALLYAITVAAIGPLDWGPVISGYVGMLLLAASLLAVGLMCSTWTDNQIVAFIISCGFCAGLYFFYMLQFFIPVWIAPLIEFISVSSHLENLSRGVIDIRDVLFYLTLTGGALFVAERSLARQHA